MSTRRRLIKIIISLKLYERWLRKHLPMLFLYCKHRIKSPRHLAQIIQGWRACSGKWKLPIPTLIRSPILPTCLIYPFRYRPELRRRSKQCVCIIYSIKNVLSTTTDLIKHIHLKEMFSYSSQLLARSLRLLIACY